MRTDTMKAEKSRKTDKNIVIDTFSWFINVQKEAT